MLIKAADDKTKRLRLLEDLQNSQRLDTRQKEWLVKELRNTRVGTRGEASAAHFLDNHLSASKNWMVIHDLRITVEGEAAQIDHLLVGRVAFILVETKTFGGDISVNEHGEFAVQYPGERNYDIPSPFEQSRRHANVLQKLLERLDIRPRTGGRHRMEHVVLVDPKRGIRRPDAKKMDTSYLVKADQFPQWHEKWVESGGVMDAFSTLVDVRGSDTVKEWAEAIVRQHRPVSQLDLPDFMQPRQDETKVHATTQAEVISSIPGRNPGLLLAEKRKLACATCGTKISFAEGKFCWNQEQRFGGYQYCREHQ
jgi:hypothetical protein